MGPSRPGQRPFFPCILPGGAAAHRQHYGSYPHAKNASGGVLLQFRQKSGVIRRYFNQIRFSVVLLC